MNRLIDILIPRFMTEDTAFFEEGDELVPRFSMRDFGPDYDLPPPWVAKVRHFNLFGMALFCQLVGEPLRFDEWLAQELR